MLRALVGKIGPATVLAIAALFGSLAVASAADDLTADLEPIRVQSALPALAASVVKGGVPVALGATGVRALGTDVPVTPDDRFHLGSDTKAMTATLAGMLVDEGKLSWSSTIGEVLEPAAEKAGLAKFNSDFAAIRLDQLLSHTSGIPSDTEAMYGLYVAASEYDMSMQARRLAIAADWGSKNTPAAPKEAPFQYANLGYLVAGAMIETAAGEAWESLITRRIFDPLQLKSAGLGPQSTPGRLDAAAGHLVADNGTATPMPWGPAADVPQVLGPAGTAHMSIRDFAAWAAWNAGAGKRGPALVKPETLAALHQPRVAMDIANPKPGTPKSGQYAFGWGIMKMDWTPRPILTHNGSNSLNLATVFIDPAIDLAIVVTTNFPGEKADKALLAVCKLLFERYGSSTALEPVRP
jgi:CubicO group peptidase (beta-lactamase class C family)